ncbi:hypothetical protein D3C87_2085230 [compost metagenome]
MPIQLAASPMATLVIPSKPAAMSTNTTATTDCSSADSTLSVTPRRNCVSLAST